MSNWAPTASALGCGLAVILAGTTQSHAVQGCTRDCTIELRKVITLAAPSEPDLLPLRPIYVAADDKGRFFMPARRSDGIVVFNTAGLRTAVLDGGKERPFRIVSSVLPGADGTLRVFDIANRTLHAFDAQLRAQTTLSTRYRPAFFLTPTRYIHAEQVRTPERVGHPIHVVGTDGTIIRSFGANEAAYRADQPLRFNRIVAPGSAESIWAIAPGRYVVEKWNPDTGQRSSQLSLSSSWFKEGSTVPPAHERPSSVVLSLWQEGEVLWILTHDADAKWRPVVMDRERALTPEENAAVTDSVLEAFDVNTGRVLASRRFDEILWGRPPSQLLASLSRDRNRLPQVDVWRARLVPNRPAR